MQADLTIIIVNWNGGRLLTRCLETIRASRSDFGVQVLVVDNDSRDGSREAAAAAFPEFEVINSGANLGFGRANNLGRERVKTPYVLFLNPDTELLPDTLQRALDCLKAHPEVGALGCRMRYPDGTVQEQGLQWFPTPWTTLLEMLLASRATRRLFARWLPTMDPNHSGYVTKLYGGFVLAPREVLDRAGWFDDRYFMYAEDVDLGQTIQQLGRKLYYSAEAEIVHVSGGTSAKAPSGFSLLMKHDSISKLMRKYHGPVGQAAHRLAVLAGAALRALLLLLPAAIATLRQSRHPLGPAASLGRQKLLILWALGLRHAQVPASPAPSPKP